MTKVRTLIVEDSLTVRKRLLAILSSDPQIEVVGEAGDGKRAIELCMELRPNVITLDMMLPVLTGLAATEYIMAHFPTPILIVSASTNRGELFKTYDALAAGAVDVYEKPHGDEVDGDWEREFIATVKLVSRIKVVSHLRGRLGALGQAPALSSTMPPLATSLRPTDGESVIAIGASTGGPSALLDVLRRIPSETAAPILIVLHLDERFGEVFADWLDAQTGRRVARAQQGAPIAQHKGRVILAPAGQHMTVRAGRIQLDRSAERHSCRPSVDVLFESLAREHGARIVAALLTGMGRDGAQGLLEVRRAGGHTIAQDEASCVVYGMPREAALLGAADQILPLHEIGAALAQASARRNGAAR